MPNSALLFPLQITQNKTLLEIRIYTVLSKDDKNNHLFVTHLGFCGMPSMGTYTAVLLDKPLQHRYSYWEKYKYIEELTLNSSVKHILVLFHLIKMLLKTPALSLLKPSTYKRTMLRQQQSPYNSCSLVYQGICFLGN